MKERSNANICKQPSMNFEGFTLQYGMIFGHTAGKNRLLFVTNGKQKQNNNIPYFNVYIMYVSEFGEKLWYKTRVTFSNNSQLYNLISKFVVKRENLGIVPEYYSSDELETHRWNNDDKACYFPKSAPYKQARCNILNKGDEYALKRKTMREKHTITQQENRCIYNSSNGHVTII